MRYYTVAVYYKKTVEDKIKQISEKYIVAAETVGDSEYKIKAWLPSDITDVNVKSCGEFQLDAILETDNDKFFLSRVSYLVDGESEKPKTKQLNVICGADSINEALTFLQDYYSEYGNEVKSISSTKLIIDEELIGKLETQDDEDE